MHPILSLILLLILLGVPSGASADIIPMGQKPIRVTAVIENLDEFPEYRFFTVESLGEEIRSVHELKPGSEISKGYKLNLLHLLAWPADRIDPGVVPDGHSLLEHMSTPRYKGDLDVGQAFVPREADTTGRVTYYRITAVDSAIHLETDRVVTFTKAGETTGTFPTNLFIRAFVITACVEIIAMFLVLRFGFRIREPGAPRIVFIVTLTQAVTLPVLWLAITRFQLMGPAIFLGAEAFAILVEAAIYRPMLRLPFVRALLASAVCNTLSVAVGLGL